MPREQAIADQKPLIEEKPRAVSEAPAFQLEEAPIPGHRILSREQKIEYRDQDGNLLNEEQIKALQGKVSFKTRFETRTRLVNAQGDELK